MPEDGSRDLAIDYCFYYPQACIPKNGRIEISGSGYGKGIHASFDMSVAPNDKDYDSWLWLIPRLSEPGVERLGDDDLSRLRPQFEAEFVGLGATGRESLLAAVPVCPRPSLSDMLMVVLEPIIAIVVLIALGIWYLLLELPRKFFGRLFHRQ